MRDFFLNLLQNLDKLTGMKQYEKLLQSADYKGEINTLLDILCRVSDQFPYIPNDVKKQIVNDAVIADQEFIGLNAKIIFKWLNAKKDFWMTQTHEPVISPDALTGEAREARLKEWQAAINGMAMVETSEGVRDRYSHIINIQPKNGEVYTPTVDEKALYEKERHLQWIQRNHDPKTAQKLPDWIPEEEFNKLYDEGLI